MQLDPPVAVVALGADGRFTIPSLAAGSYTLVVAAEGYRAKRIEFVLNADEHRTLEILLDRVSPPLTSAPAPNGAYARAAQFDLLPSEFTRRPDGERTFSPSAEPSPGESITSTAMRPIPERPTLAARAAGGVATQVLSEGYTTFSTTSAHLDPIKEHGDGYLATPSDFTVEQLRLADAGVKPNWSLEVAAGDRLLEKRLGVSVVASLQGSYQELEAERTPYGVNADNAIYIANQQARTINVDKERYALDARAEYILGENQRLNALLTGGIRVSHEVRVLDDTVVAGQGAINNSIRSTEQRQQLLGATLAGAHRFGALDLRWTGAIANSKQPRPDRTELRLYRVFDTSTAGVVVTGPTTLSALLHDWLESDNDELYGNLDATWKGWSESGLTLQGGGAVRERKRSNFQNDYRLVQRVDSAHGGTIPPFVSLDMIDVEVRNPGGTPVFGTNNYTCRETVAGAYIMGTYTLDSLQVTAGIRTEQTTGHYEAFDPNSVSVISADKSYTDLLPSVQLRYGLPAGSNVRLSVARSIVRPNYYDLVPYSTIAGDQLIAGNPYLERSRSLNFDGRYEVALPGVRALAVAGFYRVIEDPIERMIDIRNPTLPTLSTRNFGTARLAGVNLAGAVEPLAGLLLEGSYTWAHSAITNSKVVFDRAAGTTLMVDETRGLQGQPEHAAAFTAGYRDTSGRWFLQLGVNYVGRRLYQVSLYREHNDYLEPTVVLDLMLEKQLWANTSGGSLTGFIRANNLLNAVWQLREQSGLLLERERYGMGFTLGVAYSL